MSGTSLDGIDASVIKSDGEDNLDIIDLTTKEKRLEDVFINLTSKL